MKHVPTNPVESSTAKAARPSSKRAVSMLFRIVEPHRHRAILGDRIFWCERATTKTEMGLSVRWSALQGDLVLKSDCRTLNEAKNLCRIKAADEPRTERLHADLAAPGTSEEAPARWPIVSALDPCEDTE
jgi:hypothetical protein